MVPARGQSHWKVCKSWASRWYVQSWLLLCCSGCALHLAQPYYAKTPYAKTPKNGINKAVSSSWEASPDSPTPVTIFLFHLAFQNTWSLTLICLLHILLLLRLYFPFTFPSFITHICISQTNTWRTHIKVQELTLKLTTESKPRLKWSFCINLISKLPGKLE